MNSSGESPQAEKTLAHLWNQRKVCKAGGWQIKVRWNWQGGEAGRGLVEHENKNSPMDDFGAHDQVASVPELRGRGKP